MDNSFLTAVNHVLDDNIDNNQIRFYTKIPNKAEFEVNEKKRESWTLWGCVLVVPNVPLSAFISFTIQPCQRDSFPKMSFKWFFKNARSFISSLQILLFFAAMPTMAIKGKAPSLPEISGNLRIFPMRLQWNETMVSSSKFYSSCIVVKCT